MTGDRRFGGHLVGAGLFCVGQPGVVVFGGDSAVGRDTTVGMESAVGREYSAGTIKKQYSSRL